MLIDHIGSGFFENNMLMRNIGRFAFTTYAFMTAEGYFHLKKDFDQLMKHVMKIFLLALITEIPHDLFDYGAWNDTQSQSVLPTLMLGFIALILAESWREKFQKNELFEIPGYILICLAAVVVARLIRSEYTVAGVLVIVFFYQYLRYADRLNIPLRILTLLAICSIYNTIYIWSEAGFGGADEFMGMVNGLKGYFPGIFLAFLPLAFYNRKLGYYKPWFNILYSLFYPAQFIFLILVRYIRM